MGLSEKYKERYSVAFTMSEVQIRGHRVFWLGEFYHNPTELKVSQYTKPRHGGRQLCWLPLFFFLFFLHVSFLPTLLEPSHSTNRELEETSACYYDRSGEQDYPTDYMTSQMFAWCVLKNFLYRGAPLFWLVPVLHCIYNQTGFPKIYPKCKWWIRRLFEEADEIF